MHRFTDNTGRDWLLSIHVSAVKKVRALVGVDLLGLIDNEFAGLGQLLSDPVSLVDVLYALVKDDADKAGITDEDFGRAMWGDCIERASDAFLAELTDFFPDARVRTGLNKVLTAGRRVRDRLLSHAGTELDRIDVESIAQRLITSSGNSRESSG